MTHQPKHIIRKFTSQGRWQVKKSICTDNSTFPKHNTYDERLQQVLSPQLLVSHVGFPDQHALSAIVQRACALFLTLYEPNPCRA
jgi:hypothetical protein